CPPPTRTSARWSMRSRKVGASARSEAGHEPRVPQENPASSHSTIRARYSPAEESARLSGAGGSLLRRQSVPDRDARCGVAVMNVKFHVVGLTKDRRTHEDICRAAAC